MQRVKIFLEKMDNRSVSLRQKKKYGTEPTSLQLFYEGAGEQQETITSFKIKDVSATYLLIF